ncbi:hypothetical protein MKW98_003542 [Papaver atlanticum]|uniref:DWNN domain-containing protein n=1 Tax=Papaver atlanticum TaxID=357466 RepID=A0AAD4XTU3_9MAGN|nr:hypothetical protein MKW98_003542 [Papaver atlanticum]
MAVYVKFKSAKDFFSVPVTSAYTSVSELKSLIRHSKKYGHGKDYDITITNPLTNEDYSEDELILKNSSVLVRRIPGVPPPSIVIKSKKEEEEEEKDKMEAQKALEAQEERSNSKLNNETVLTSQSQGVSNVSKGGISTMSSSCFGPTGQGNFRVPPEGYICYRCRVPGHFIQHCPTNGDPEYDIKRPRPPTGIPKSMLTVNADGSYALPGAVAVMNPNGAAFEKEVESTASGRVMNFPPELYCPLCKEVMKDAVLTRKCCFQSFCNECIRGNIISKFMCICGVKNIPVDDLIPNKTLRDTINSYLKSSDSSAGNTKSTLTTEDTGSARSSSLPKIPSPADCGGSKTEKILSSVKEEISDAKEVVNEGNHVGVLQKSLEKGKSEDEAQSSIQKEQSSASLVQNEVQQRKPPCDLGNKKKKEKKSFSSLGGKPLADGDLFWGTSEAIAAENYMGPFSTSAYNNSYWGMQYGMYGYMAPYNYYGYSHTAAPYGGMYTQNPFGGDQGSYAPREREHIKDQEFSKEVSRSADRSSIKANEAQKRPMTKKSHNNENIGQHTSRTKSSSQGKRSRDTPDSSSQGKKSRVTPDRCDYSSDVDNGDDERNFKRKRSWY